MTKSAYVLILILAIGPVVAGCSGAGEISKDFRLNNKSDTGLAVVSLTRTNTPGYCFFEDYSIFISLRGVNNDFEVSTPLWEVFTNDKGYTEGEEPEERLAVFELPSGQYEFFNWEGYGLNSEREKISPGKEFSKKFIVRPGRLSYLGNIHMVFSGNRYMMMVMDMRKTDIPLLTKKYPGLKAEPVAYKIIR